MREQRGAMTEGARHMERERIGLPGESNRLEKETGTRVVHAGDGREKDASSLRPVVQSRRDQGSNGRNYYWKANDNCWSRRRPARIVFPKARSARRPTTPESRRTHLTHRKKPIHPFYPPFSTVPTPMDIISEDRGARTLMSLP